MFTSYFSNPQLKKATNLRLVAISRGIPKWFKGEAYQLLAPTWAMIKLENRDEYTCLYDEILKRLDAESVVNDLKDSVILCWEKPGDFCHRYLVAKWIEEKTGLHVPEYGIKNQLTLF